LGKILSDRINQKPKQALMLMILLLTLSIIANLIFDLARGKNRPKQPDAAPIGNMADPLNDGFGQLIRAGASIFELKELQKEVESIAAKEKWTREDSLKFRSAYEKIKNYRR